MDASLAAAMMALHTSADGGGGSGGGGGGGDMRGVVELGATGSSVAGGPLGHDVPTTTTTTASTTAVAGAPGASSIASDEYNFASVSMFFYYSYHLFCSFNLNNNSLGYMLVFLL